MNVDLRALADVLVVCTLIRILEPAPAADVIDENCTEVSLASFHIMDQLLQSVSPFDPEATFAGVGVSSNDHHAAPLGIVPNDIPLVFRGVLLMLSRHANVFGGGQCRRFGRC